MNKQCKKCGETKAFKFFYDAPWGDGKSSKCITCNKEYYKSKKDHFRKYYKKNRKKSIKRSLEYTKKRLKEDPEFKQKYDNYIKQWQKDNREKINERERLNRFNSLGVYLTTFKEGTYVGEGITYIRKQCHKGGYSNVNKGDLTFIKFEVLEFIQDETKRKEREKYWINKLNPSLNTLL